MCQGVFLDLHPPKQSCFSKNVIFKIIIKNNVATSMEFLSVLHSLELKRFG